MKELHFWFDPASTYSWPAAFRITGLAQQAGVTVVWRPFLLGPVFKAQGLDNSPFAVFPVKGRYMWRDMARICRDLGLPFRIPEEAELARFPRNSLLAARAAIVALREPWGREFVVAVYRAEFGDGADISDPVVLAAIARQFGADGEELLAQAQSDAVKAELRANTAEALDKGIFGAPFFMVGEEPFWGNDRLEAALRHAARSGEPS